MDNPLPDLNASPYAVSETPIRAVNPAAPRTASAITLTPRPAKNSKVEWTITLEDDAIEATSAKGHAFCTRDEFAVKAALFGPGALSCLRFKSMPRAIV